MARTRRTRNNSMFNNNLWNSNHHTPKRQKTDEEEDDDETIEVDLTYSSFCARKTLDRPFKVATTEEELWIKLLAGGEYWFNPDESTGKAFVDWLYKVLTTKNCKINTIKITAQRGRSSREKGFGYDWVLQVFNDIPQLPESLEKIELKGMDLHKINPLVQLMKKRHKQDNLALSFRGSFNAESTWRFPSASPPKIIGGPAAVLAREGHSLKKLRLVISEDWLVEKFITQVAQLKHVKDLTLIFRSPADCTDAVVALLESNKIEKLSMPCRHKGYGYVDFEALCIALTRMNTSLTHLEYGQYLSSKKDLQWVDKLMKHNSTLASLKLFCPEGPDYLKLYLDLELLNNFGIQKARSDDLTMKDFVALLSRLASFNFSNNYKSWIHSVYSEWPLDSLDDEPSFDDDELELWRTNLYYGILRQSPTKSTWMPIG